MRKEEPRRDENRVRLSVNRLEERETPSGVDPTGGTTTGLIDPSSQNSIVVNGDWRL